jgi:MFS family permease
MQSFKQLIPLLAAAGILLAGNGMQGTLIALRGSSEGYAPSMIGLMGAAYFAGFLIGCWNVPRLLRAVGHIRTFASLAAIAACASLLLVLLLDPYAWVGLRFISGLCFSGLFTTVESWLNSSVDNVNRGRVLSIYRIIDLSAVTAGQFLIPLLGIDGFTVFAVLSIMVTLSLVPVSLADRSQPKLPDTASFSLRLIWNLSPIACIGCMSIGLTNSAFRLVGPLYAQSIGMSINSVAAFISAGIIGGAVLQYPLGVLSDRYDRRIVLLIATAGAALTGLYLSSMAGQSPLLNYIGIFGFGAFALPLYSLSAAHANDHAGENDYVVVATGLTFFFSLGAIIGPLLSSSLIDQFGPRSLFAYTTVVHVLLIVLILWRMRARAPVPSAERGRFVTLLRTSPAIFRLARRRK